MKNKRMLIFTIVTLVIIMIYAGGVYYNSDEVKFKRYYKKITSISREDVKAIDVTLKKNNVIYKSYFDKEESFLMLDLLQDMRTTGYGGAIGKGGNYTYDIWNAIETSKSSYLIKLEVDESNYNIRVTEINVDRNKGKRIQRIGYFETTAKSEGILRELLNEDS